MLFSLPLVGRSICARCAVFVVAMMIACAPSWAITVGYTDDFNYNNTNGWRVGQTGGNFPQVIEDNGQGGTGDHTLFMATAGAGGDQPRLLIMNDTAMNDGNWEGNWTAAGIRQVSLDVFNPNEFPLKMRLGIAGPEGAFQGGGGDTFVTDPIDVAANTEMWQRIVFSVRAEDFNLGAPRDEFLDPAPVLAAVTHFRILHNPSEEEPFLGEFIAGQFFVDNIEASGVPEPASWLFMTGLFVYAWVVVRRRV